MKVSLSKWVVGGALAAMAIAASGCGGGEDSSSTATVNSSLTKAKFVEQANKICSEGGKKAVTGLVAYKAADKSDAEQIDEISNSILIPAYQEVIDEVRDLGVPEGDEAQIEAFLTAMERALEADAAHPASSIGLLLPRLEQRFRQPSRLARAYGLDGCAYG